MKPVGGALINGWLGKAITRLVGRPGSLRFRLARETSASVVGRRNWDIWVREASPSPVL